MLNIKTCIIRLKVSLPDVSIGKTSITDLRAINNVEIQNEIRVLLPYLEVTSNHGYLIARLKTLATVGLQTNFLFANIIILGWLSFWVHLEWWSIL